MTDAKTDAGKDWSHWGHLAERYATPRPRRMLTLDGGGIRGVLSAEVLVKLEELLRAKLGKPNLVLADYFDYIAGTSTGAIMAACLAIGMPAKDVQTLYLSFGQQVFKRESLFSLWKNLYEGGALEQLLKQKLGAERRLRPADLRTLLLVVTRNATTDSAWPISSNPDAKYNEHGRDYNNLDFHLWQVVRASTAAPVFFPPEVIAMQGAKGERKFVFVDGGTTAYNNAAFLLYKMATAPAYRLAWPSGERKLLIVSVGTGTTPVEGPTFADPEMNMVANGVKTLRSVLYQAQIDQDLSCRTIGRCVYGGVLDREVHDLIPVDPPDQARVPLARDLGRAFLYARYDVDLTREGLDQLGLSDIDPRAVSELDSVGAIPQLQAIGRRLAARIDLEHFGTFV